MKRQYFQINRITIFLIIFGAANSLFLSAQTFTSSNLPIVVINTNGQTIVNEPKITADMGIIDNGPGIRNNLTDPFNHYNGKIGIEIRGSSTQMFPKKQYGLETRDSLGESSDVSIFGFPAESDWILSASYNDKTLMRDALTYTLANSMGRYASRTRYCEVVINDQYQGVYIFFEKIKRDKNRVNISKLDSTGVTGDALTGGYIIKVDKLDGSGVDGWNSPFVPYQGAWQRVYYQYHFPKAEDITTAQKNYIKTFINTVEGNFYVSSFADTVNGYVKYIDVNSAVDFFIINELTRNVDGFRLSMFMYKDKDSKNSKLFLGPVWDFNHGYGNCDYYDAWKTEGWQMDYNTTNTDFLKTDQFVVPFWWPKLMNDPNFMAKVGVRWTELRKKQLSVTSVNSWIDSVVVLLNEGQSRNFQKWPILNTYVWPNYYIGKNYSDEITYLKQWYSDRVSWMDFKLTGRYLYTPDKTEQVIKNFSMSQNYPNPFNPNTTISYQLPVNSFTVLKVYDAIGRETATLVNEHQEAGTYSVQFSGKFYSSGIYFYRIHAGEFSTIKRMTLIK